MHIHFLATVGGIGETCGPETICGVPNSECVAGECACDPGYTPSESETECLSGDV